MRDFEAGAMHIFGKVKLSPWKVAEMTAELGKIETKKRCFVADDYLVKCHSPEEGLKSLVFKVILIMKLYESSKL